MKHFLKATVLAVSASMMAASVALAAYPEKEIQMLVGFSAGGGTDVMARTVAPFVEKYLGNGAKIVIKNIPGAGGRIAVTAVAEAAPDGYTLGTYNLPGVMARTIDGSSVKYTADSFTFLANMVNDPNVIVTGKNTGIDTLAKLLDKAKKEPGALTVGMAALSGDDRFALTTLENATGTKFNVVPFKGTAPTRSAVMGGHVPVAVMNVSEVTSFRNEFNVLGVTSTNRSAFAPDIPTLKEQGANVINGSLRGFVGPKGMPAEIAAKLISAFKKAYDDPKLQEAMKASGNVTEWTAGDDFKALNAEQLQRAKDVFKATPWK
ncbi:MAG: tripartite tricarboxylate transporter substrate binding protein [Burkholderiales bacterium]|nr:tripartite tricarboxylate transporter substrate binding protein [Burkholderiales bacterium]